MLWEEVVPGAVMQGLEEAPLAGAVLWEEVVPGAVMEGLEEAPLAVAVGLEEAQHEVKDFDLVLLIPRMEATVAPQFCYSNQCNLHQVYNQHRVVYKVSHDTFLPICQTG